VRVAAIILCLAISASAADLKTQPSFKLSEVLPVGQCELEIMDIQFTARAIELTRKLQASIATNKEWFSEYAKTRSKPGVPLEYDQAVKGG
jgi:hypothetical protein